MTKMPHFSSRERERERERDIKRTITVNQFYFDNLTGKHTKRVIDEVLREIDHNSRCDSKVDQPLSKTN